VRIAALRTGFRKEVELPPVEVDIVTVAPKPVPVNKDGVDEAESVGRLRLHPLFTVEPSQAAVLFPPFCVVLIETVTPLEDPTVICGTSVLRYWPPNVTVYGPDPEPVTDTSPELIVDRPTRAVWIAEALVGYVIELDELLPLNRSRNESPLPQPLREILWTSFVPSFHTLGLLTGW
jgi:hypothetical protein